MKTTVRYVAAAGKEPFTEWLLGLRDRMVRARILIKIDRFAQGNVSNVESVGEGVHELKINIGSGFRVYFGNDDPLVILLAGGDKSSQSRDINKAKEYWNEYKKNKKS